MIKRGERDPRRPRNRRHRADRHPNPRTPAPHHHPRANGHPAGLDAVAEALIVAEVAGYWGHRLSHEIPLLWKFHRVHHTAANLDWLATNRRHPIDAMIDRLSTALPMIALGFPVPTILAVFVAKRFRGSFVHSNTNIRFGVLERIYVTPFFHHWHHSNEPDTRNTNYALSFPAIDWLFGTLHLPDRWPDDYGCDGTTPDTGYLNRLLNPWSTPTPTRRAPERARLTSSWTRQRLRHRRSHGPKPGELTTRMKSVRDDERQAGCRLTRPQPVRTSQAPAHVPDVHPIQQIGARWATTSLTARAYHSPVRGVGKRHRGGGCRGVLERRIDVHRDDSLSRCQGLADSQVRSCRIRSRPPLLMTGVTEGMTGVTRPFPSCPSSFRPDTRRFACLAVGAFPRPSFHCPTTTSRIRSRVAQVPAYRGAGARGQATPRSDRWRGRGRCADCTPPCASRSKVTCRVGYGLIGPPRLWPASARPRRSMLNERGGPVISWPRSAATTRRLSEHLASVRDPMRGVGQHAHSAARGRTALPRGLHDLAGCLASSAFGVINGPAGTAPSRPARTPTWRACRRAARARRRRSRRAAGGRHRRHGRRPRRPLPTVGQADEAITIAEETLAVARAHADPVWIALVLAGYGRAHTHADPTRALTTLRDGLNYTREHRVPFLEAVIAREGLAELEPPTATSARRSHCSTPPLTPSTGPAPSTASSRPSPTSSRAWTASTEPRSPPRSTAPPPTPASMLPSASISPTPSTTCAPSSARPPSTGPSPPARP